jgi:hypothetical protein
MLILTVVVNIFAFRYFIQTLFPLYLEKIAIENIGSNSDQLQAIIQIGQLGIEAQDEYTTVIKELSNLSSAIKNISTNPDLYAKTGSGPINPEVFSIPSTLTSSGTTPFQTK